MADKKLAKTVWVDGVMYAAGSTPPAEAAEKITNKKAWEDDEAGLQSGDDERAERGSAQNPDPSKTPTAVRPDTLTDGDPTGARQAKAPKR